MKVTTLLVPLFLVSSTSARSLFSSWTRSNQVPVLNYYDKELTYEDCGSSEDVFQVGSIEFSPNPPEREKVLTMTINGTLSQDLEEGAYADVTVKLGLIKLLQKQYDLCEEFKNCPYKKGAVSFEKTLYFDKSMPAALFNVAIHAFTAEDDNLACVKIKADFTPDRPGALHLDM